MTIKEALDIRRDFYGKSLPSEEEVFLFTEAMEFLIRETKQPEYMMNLGGYYYEHKQFDLALKYYEMAAAMKDVDANICLGYIWYYGRTGTRDYEKAFHYFTIGKEAGDLQSTYKVADMYKNGYFVDKDYDKYCSIIEELYPKVKKCRNLNDPVPEVFTRLARIRMEQGEYRSAKKLLASAKEYLSQRIYWHPFFGDLSIMKWLIQDQYSLPEDMKPRRMDLYDLYHYLEKPAVIRFRYEEEDLVVRSLMENGECVIQFGDRWFRNVDDFFAKAEYDGTLLTELYEDLHDWEVQDGTDQS